jgi:hypothetical protein
MLAPALIARAVAAQVPAPPQWRITEDLRIDAGREDLISFSALAIGPAGEVTIPQAGDGRILVFDSLGRRVSAMGRSGQGPGEFQRVGSVGWMGDTLWAGDSRANHVSLFTRSGQYIRRITTHHPTMERTGFSGNAIGLAATVEAVYPGAMGMLMRVTIGDLTPTFNCYCWVWMGATGELRAAVASRPPSLDPGVSYQGGSSAVPFAWTTQRDVAPDGSRVGVLFATPADRAEARYRVVVLGQRGDTVFNRAFGFERVVIPQSEIERVLASRARGVQGLSGRIMGPPPSVIAELRARIPRYYVPWFSMGVWQGIPIGRDGTVWIGLRGTGDGHPWIVLSAAGDPIGRVTLPQGVWLQEAEQGRIWASQENSDGLRSVVRYRITAGQGIGGTHDVVSAQSV